MGGWGRVRVLSITAVLALVGGAGLVACHMPGAQLDVNTTADGVDAAPGDGVCEVTPGVGDCSLRAAVMEANAEAGTNDIEIGDGNTYQLGSGGGLTISDSVSINGHSTINGGGPVISVTGGGADIAGATISGGTNLGDGGGIFVSPDASLVLENATVTGNRADDGGGIAALGATQLFSSRVVGNTATGETFDEATLDGFGGGIFANGQLLVRRSTIENNAGASGSGITAAGHAAVDIESSLIDETVNHENQFVNVVDSLIVGSSSAAVTINESTVEDDVNDAALQGVFSITGSTIDGSSALVFGPSTTATVAASALHSSLAVCGTAATLPLSTSTPPHVTSGGYNVVSDSSCGFSATGDVQGVALLLGFLADAGGPTKTRAPFANSPVVNLIPASNQLCTASATDQRGDTRPRVAGDACDAGAFEGPLATPIDQLHLTVTSAADTGDVAPGDGVCADSSGGCSLRAAIEETNAWPTADEIRIAAGVNPSTFGISVSDDLTIDGNGATVSNSSTNTGFVFQQAGGRLTVEHLTMSVPNAAFGGFVIDANAGTLHLVDDTVVGTPSVNNTGQSGTSGILSFVPTTIDSSTLIGNGQGISLSNAGWITNSTFSDNGRDDAGTFTLNTGSFAFVNNCAEPATFDVHLSASTLANHHGASAIVSGCPSHLVLSGNIVQAGLGFTCGPGSDVNDESRGYNLFSGGDPTFNCGTFTTGDRRGDPNLGPLASNGGPTRTLLPMATSAAVDAIPVGTPGLCVTGSVDQRHVARPVGTACDIGAVEGTAAVP
jgi:CSLREA domain-containing protein